MRVGTGYAADYDSDWVNYELVVRLFTGEEMCMRSSEKSSDKMLTVATDQGSRSSVIELEIAVLTGHPASSDRGNFRRPDSVSFPAQSSQSFQVMCTTSR